jgi:hypothetical protein
LIHCRNIGSQWWFDNGLPTVSQGRECRCECETIDALALCRACRTIAQRHGDAGR